MSPANWHIPWRIHRGSGLIYSLPARRWFAALLFIVGLSGMAFAQEGDEAAPSDAPAATPGEPAAEAPLPLPPRPKQEAAPDAPAPDEPSRPAPAAEADPLAEARRTGRLITIPSPITNNIDTRIQRLAQKLIDDAQKTKERPVLIFEIEPGSNKRGAAHDLADYISNLSNAEVMTVAYIPQSIEGHSLLLAMACDQIVMGPDAELGSAGADEDTITDAMRSQYAEIASRHRTVPKALALAMLDPQLEVWKVETETDREFVLTDDLEDLRQRKAFVLPERPLKPAGEAFHLTGDQARELGIVNLLAADRGALVKELGLPREAAFEDLAADGPLRAVSVRIKGLVTPNLIGQAQGAIQDAVRDNANFICVWIESPGGGPDASLSLANLLTGPEMKGRRTVAFIPTEARADAAYIALACDDIVMLPDAVLGGGGAFQIGADAVPATVASIKECTKAKFRAWSLPAAIVDPKLRVYRYTNRRDGLVEFFCEEEAAAQARPDDWQQGEEVTTPGRAFQADGNDAERLGLAHHVVDDFHGFKTLYGLENDPRLVEPGWADILIDALAEPGVAWLLLMIGGAALYAEFHSPGVGVGAFVAGVCFLLFFWAKFLGGTAGWLEVLLFLTGLICLLVEIFVLPGFSIFGLGGGLLIIGSLVLASQTFTQLPQNDYQFAELRNSFAVVVGAMFGVIVAISFLNRYLAKTPVLSSVVLSPPSDEEQATIARREAVASYEHLLGREGLTTTQLTPAGKARFDDLQVDVLADGEVIARGTPVRVVEAHGNRVLVRRIV